MPSHLTRLNGSFLADRDQSIRRLMIYVLWDDTAPVFESVCRMVVENQRPSLPVPYVEMNGAQGGGKFLIEDMTRNLRMNLVSHFSSPERCIFSFEWI
jgi:hypothetical protein